MIKIIRKQKSKKIKILEKIAIFMEVLALAVSFTMFFTLEQDSTWLMLGLSWVLIVIMHNIFIQEEEYNNNIIKLQDSIIEMKEKEIKQLEKIFEKAHLEVDVDRIKIPKKYKKPSENKIRQKTNYYYEHNEFESEIIINSNFILIDGYTSYLIAKEKHFKKVLVKIKAGDELYENELHEL